MVTIFSFHLELPENSWKYFYKFCNPFDVVTINCVMYFKLTLRLIFHNWVTFSDFVLDKISVHILT